MKAALTSRAALSLVLPLGTTFAFAQEQEKPVNDGQDPLTPIKRFDFRAPTLQDTGDFGRSILTLRTDAVLPIKGGKWGTYYARIDAPFQWTNAIGMDNADAKTRLGVYENEARLQLFTNLSTKPGQDQWIPQSAGDFHAFSHFFLGKISTL